MSGVREAMYVLNADRKQHDELNIQRFLKAHKSEMQERRNKQTKTINRSL